MNAASPRSAARSIGIDVGGTKTLGVLVEHGPDGPSVLDRAQVPSDAGRPSAVDAIIRVAWTLFDRDPAAVPVAGIGVGLAGFVDVTGVVRAAPNSPGLIDQDVRGRVEAALGLTCVVDNDANCAALASRRIVAPEARDLVAITFGTGIGGGLIVDGDLVRGARGYAGEPGHMVVDPTGPLCPCGQHGCWERYASGSGLARLAREAVAQGAAPALAASVDDPDELCGEHVTELLAEGDPGASLVFDVYAGWVALGVANLVNLLDPEVVVLGGGVIATGDDLLVRVRRIVADRFPAAGAGREVPIVAAPGGPESGAIGAGLLVVA